MRLMGVDAKESRSWRALVSGAVAGLVLLGACGGDDGDNADDGTDDTEAAGSSESESEETTTTTLSAEGEVLAAYEDARAAVAAAYDPADPEHPDLLASFDGRALRLHQTTLGDLQSQGLSDVATSDESDPKVLSVVADTAVVEDCIVQELQKMSSDTREPQGAPREVATHIEWSLERIDDAWKVVQGETLGESC